MKDTSWFSSWFNTPYYHILYKDRNDKDAQLFMRNITSFLKLPITSHIFDVPCGKGRHAVFLNSLGYKVTGGDLSKNSIQHAKQYENNTLSFKVCDIRKSFDSQYDAIFNLFTSFGYFEKDEDDILVLKNIKNALKVNGVLVLDFLNAEYVKRNLVKEEIKIVDSIVFNISREISNGFILKHIEFIDKGKQYKFTEKVKYIDVEKFQHYFTNVGFDIKHIFGGYNLETYKKQSSKRLILVANK